MHASTTEKEFRVWGTIIADWESNRMTNALYVVVPSGEYVVVLVVVVLCSEIWHCVIQQVCPCSNYGLQHAVGESYSDVQQNVC